MADVRIGLEGVVVVGQTPQDRQNANEGNHLQPFSQQEQDKQQHNGCNQSDNVEVLEEEVKDLEGTVRGLLLRQLKESPNVFNGEREELLLI